MMFGRLTDEELNEACESLSEYERIRPDVVTLAMLASLARRIEPELLRALRLALSDRFSADIRPNVATEAALWFSPFIESRGPDNITLLPEFSQLLRERLMADQEILKATNNVIKDCHQLISPVIRWEEELIYLSLNKNISEPERKQVFEQLVWRMVKAISEGNRPALEEWVVEMGIRLPKVANINPLLAQLRNLSAARIIRRDLSPTVSVSLNLAELDFLNVPSVVLDVLKIEDKFRIGHLSGLGQFGIRVPDTQMITIDIMQPASSSDATISLVIPPGEYIEIPLQPNPIRIRTTDGQIYSLDPNLFDEYDLFKRDKISESFQQKRRLQPDKVLRGHSGQVWGVAITPDNRWAISGSYDNTLRVWDLHSGVSLNTLYGHTDKVFRVIISPDGRFAVSCSADGTIRVWDLDSGGNCIAILKGHTQGVYCVAVTQISAVNKKLYTGGLSHSTTQDTLKKGFEQAGTVESAIIITDKFSGRSKGFGFVEMATEDEAHKARDMFNGKGFDGRRITVSEGRPIGPRLHHDFGNNSYDGLQIISGSFDKTVRIWDLKTSQCIATLEGHTDSVFSVAVSPDGQYAVSASGDRTLRIWNLKTQQCIAKLEGHAQAVDCVAVMPDGRSILSGSRDHTIRIWDSKSCKCLAVLEGHGDAIVSLAVSSDGRWALTSSFDKTVRIWDLINGTCIKSIGLTKYLISIALTSDRHQAILGSEDHAVWVWNLPANFEVNLSKPRFEYDVFLSYSSKDKKTIHALANRLRIGGLRVWLSEWVMKPGDSIPLETSLILLICMSPAYFDSEWRTLEYHLPLFMGSPNVQRRIIPLLIEECSKPDIIAQFAYIDWRTPSDEAYNKLLADCRNREAKTTRPRAIEKTVDQAQIVLKGHNREVRGVAITLDGKTIVSASYDRTLKVWDLASGHCRATFTSHSADINDLAITPDGSTAITTSDDKTLKVWDLATGKCQATFEGHIELVGCVAITPDGKIAVSGSNDTTLKVWDLSTGKSRATFTGHNGPVLGLAIAPNGKTIVSGSGDKTLKIWDLATSRCQSTFAGHTGEIYGVAITPDGKTIISGSSDNTLKVWDLATSQCLATFEGHTNTVLDVAITPDGKTIISGSSDGTLKVWDLTTGQCFASLKGHNGHVFRVAVTPDGKKIISGSWDGTLRVWDLPQSGTFIKTDHTLRYTNAKVILVGDTGVGKTGLALRLCEDRFESTESTHGMIVSLLKLPLSAKHEGVEREVWLWDYGGRPSYSLIHQLHLNDVAVALVVFDARSEIDPLAGVRHWDSALRLARQRQDSEDVPMKKFLVSARNDRGGISIGEDQLQAVLKEFRFDGYFKTSAKEGWQIKELRSAIEKAIPWEHLPEVSSSQLFADIQSFLLDMKRTGRLLAPASQLYEDFTLRYPYREEAANLRDQFDTCIGRLENRNLVRHLSFGDYVLLQPEISDAYAYAMVSTAKEEPDGLGSLPEEIALAGKFFVPKELKVRDPSQEQLLLHATIEELVRHDLVLHENSDNGRYLVFPSQFNRDYEDAPEPKGKAAAITFDGPVQSLYATLVVRLGHSGLFTTGRAEMWRNTAIFTAKAGGKCGIFLQESAEAHGRLILFFVEHASIETQLYFEEFVLAHIKHLSREGTVKLMRFFVCPDCGVTVPDSYAKSLREKGKTIFNCPCGGTVSLVEPEERIHYRSEIEAMDRSANWQQDFDALVISAKGEMSTRSFQEWAGGERIRLAIMFTDVICSRALGEEIGNEAMNEAMRVYFTQSRKLIDKFNGREIKTIGDSFMAAFKSVDTALDYAIALHRNTSHPQIQIRAGIHVGPMNAEDDDVFGGTVSFIACMVGAIKDAEIYLSDRAKRDIDQLGAARFKNLGWKCHYGVTMKGFPSSFTLWSVQMIDHDSAATLMPVRVFVSYAHEDKRRLKRLDAILDVFEQQHALEPWSDRQLIAGDKWDGEIRRRLDEMDIFLFIASQTSLVLPYIKDVELKRAMERHKAGEVEVAVVKLEPCTCDDDPILSKLQRLAPKFKSITEVSPRSKAWEQVRKDLLPIIQRAQKKKKSAKS